MASLVAAANDGKRKKLLGDLAKSDIDSTEEVFASKTPELVIALCGPIGSALHETAGQIGNALREFGYIAEKIRLSDFIELNASDVGVEISNVSKFAHIKSKIDAGDALRKQYGVDVLAKLAIAKIAGDRRKKFGEFGDAAKELGDLKRTPIRNQRLCHIIDSIKNDGELELFRLIYGDVLFSVGVFSTVEVRRRNLEARGLLGEDIERLIDLDSGEEFAHGQSVRNTFPQCDFFLRIDDPMVGPTEPRAVGQIVEKIRRFLGLIFRTAVTTPTGDETAMYAAASAARNSACLSRQVGAAVTSAEGELLAVGWNDVPQKGGGLYGKPPIGAGIAHARREEAVDREGRCFARDRICHNDLEKTAIAARIVEGLVRGEVIARAKEGEATALVLGGVKDLIEFSRAVHAEMHAILGASRVAGDRILGGRLYVTTYPCHSCARHLIAAGISDVIYIEPYRKSLATKLHDDAISEAADDADKVRLLQFDGVAPRRFIALFEAGVRKAGGVLSLPDRQSASPATLVSLKAIPRLEEVVVAEVDDRHLKFASLVDGDDAHDESKRPEAPA